MSQGHYHCIECGTLFKAPILDLSEQRCSVCGNPPTGKILAGTALDRKFVPGVRSSGSKSKASQALHGEGKDTQEIFEATVEAQKSQRQGRVRRTKRKGKKSNKLWMLLGFWLLVMGGGIGVMKYYNQNEDSVISAEEVDTERKRIAAELETKKKSMAVAAARPGCERAMSSFLNATSAAAKAQYVYQGAKLSSIIAKYYQKNPTFSSTRSKIRIVYGEFLEVPGEKVIGALCQNTFGERFEAIFILENKEWKIDWKSFVKYDASSWPLFRSKADGAEGDFRLYVRVRDTDEDLKRKNMNVVFYKPKIYFIDKFKGLASKSVSVPFDSEAGKGIGGMLEEGGAQKEDVYGFRNRALDPPGFHRVRVRLRLHKKEGKETYMEIVEILANHWYGLEPELPGKSGE